MRLPIGGLAPGPALAAARRALARLTPVRRLPGARARLSAMGARGRGALALALAAALLGPSRRPGATTRRCGRCVPGTPTRAGRPWATAPSRPGAAWPGRPGVSPTGVSRSSSPSSPARPGRGRCSSTRATCAMRSSTRARSWSSAPGRPVVAAGPRTPAEITLALRRSGANRDPDPVDRVIRAAEAAAPPAPAGSWWRGVLGFALLAALGALWAAAWGVRRERRRQRTAIADARRAGPAAARRPARPRAGPAGPGRSPRRRPPRPGRGHGRGRRRPRRARVGRLGAEDLDRAVASLERAERRLREAAALAGEHLDPGRPRSRASAPSTRATAPRATRRGSVPASVRSRCARPARLAARAGAPPPAARGPGARAAGPVRRGR